MIPPGLVLFSPYAILVQATVSTLLISLSGRRSRVHYLPVVGTHCKRPNLSHGIILTLLVSVQRRIGIAQCDCFGPTGVWRAFEYFL